MTSTNAGVDPIGVAGFQSARVWCKSKVMTTQFDKTLLLLVNGLPYLRGAPPGLPFKDKQVWLDSRSNFGFTQTDEVVR